MTDAQRWQQLKAGDRQALAALVEGAYPAVYAYCYPLFGFGVPVPLVRLGGYFLMAAVLLPLAARGWAKRQIS